MFQRLTAAGRYAIVEQFDSMVWAYAAVCIEAGVFGLGICVRGEPGYYPVPSWMCCGVTLEVAAHHADELNRDRGLAEEAVEIVSSSMRHGRVRA